MKLESEIVIEILEECRKLETEPIAVFKALRIIYSKRIRNQMKSTQRELYNLAENRHNPINKRKLELHAKNLRIEYVDLLSSIYSSYPDILIGLDKY